MSSLEIVIVSMPFFDFRLPSAQLAVLKAYLSWKKIPTKCIYAYLEFCKCIGKRMADIINNYEYAEYFFIKSTYPERYEKNKKEIDDRLRLDLDLTERDLEQIYIKIEKYVNEIVFKIEEQRCAIVAFSITYKQMLPSICVSKRLKKGKVVKKILFGGSRVSGDLGVGLFEHEDCVDTLISGEGEYALTIYITDYYKQVYGGKYLAKKYIEAERPVILETIPPPDYDDFFEELSNCGITTNEIMIFYEVARGCWWNKCTFCSSNRLYKEYREKTALKVANDLFILCEKYKPDIIWLLGDCYTFKSYVELANLMEESDRRCNLIIYSRCSSDFNYYKAIKKLGATSLIVGIEAVSDSLLRKMNKGCNAIRNIQCLKYCAQIQLNCIYNLFYGYPNFSKKDFNETMDNIDYILGYQPPESLCDMELQYGSRVYLNQKDFEITSSLSDRKEEMVLPDGAKTFRYEYYTISDHSQFSQKISEKIFLWNDLHEKEGFDVLTYKKRMI